uniref:YfcC family protein n=1 Tax=Rufibacter psychrotolerans TaxID=2812556 RepID=UPI001F075653|nr:YfcC family protein [Rufibacter sp. SYSU D00308]
MKNIPHPITILFIVILLAAAATWLVPAGAYAKLVYEQEGAFALVRQGERVALPFKESTLDSLGMPAGLESFAQGETGKTLSVPGSFHRLPQNAQGLLAVVKAPLRGFQQTVEIILFLLLIGGFMSVFYATGALERGLQALATRMQGREGWLIIVLTFLFSFGGASFGMAEEGLAFYPILVPLFLAAGYDLLVPVAVIFGGAQLGLLSSFSNPFSTIIASNAAGVLWTDGMYTRLFLLFITSLLYIWYVARYASAVKKAPERSLVLRHDGAISSPFLAVVSPPEGGRALSGRCVGLLVLFVATFLTMVAGVIFFGWWLVEMSAVFLVASVLVGLIMQMNEKEFLAQFIKGAEGMVVVAFIIGTARGVGILLEDGNISDSLVYYPAQWISAMPPGLFIVGLLVFYMVLTFFIPSTSGIAVVTMPIMGSLATVAEVPGREIVNAYLFGMGIAGFVIPTGLALPSLSLVNVSLKTWWKFIGPVLPFLFVLCSLFLLAGVYLN